MTSASTSGLKVRRRGENPIIVLSSNFLQAVKNGHESEMVLQLFIHYGKTLFLGTSVFSKQLNLNEYFYVQKRASSIN